MAPSFGCRSSHTDFGSLFMHSSSVLPRDSDPADQTADRNSMCTLKFQQSVVEVNLVML